jgi:hypothetical protein
VRAWAEAQTFDYRWISDDLFDRLPGSLKTRTRAQPVIASDLARLIVLQEAFEHGYERAVWVDADVLVTEPSALMLPQADALFGREVWVQEARGGRLKVYRKIHNAFMAFTVRDPVLPFYRMSAERILSRYDPDAGPMVAQLIGPKLITLLHNAIGFDVLESAGVLSPAVVRDLIGRGGRALDRFIAESAVMPLALNLCGSTVRGGELTDREMGELVGRLQSGALASG